VWDYAEDTEVEAYYTPKKAAENNTLMNTDAWYDDYFMSEASHLFIGHK